MYLDCSTVQYRSVQYSTVQYSTVQISTVQCSTVQYSTVQYSTVANIMADYYQDKIKIIKDTIPRVNFDPLDHIRKAL